VLSKITYIDTGSNLGFSGGMNVGIRHARRRGADRILLVNSDVIVPPDAVEQLERVLDSAPRAGIVGPVVLARSEPDRIATLGMSYAAATGRMRHRGTGDRASDHRPAAGGEVVDAVSGCLMLIKSEVFDAVGLLDERYFLYTEDVDLCAAIRARGRRILFTPAATITHLRGRSRATRPAASNAAYRRSHLAFYEKHHPRWAPILRLYLRLRGQMPRA